jgi:glycine cleavage system aminomethyltransferase T
MALEGFKLTYDFGDPAAEAMTCRTNCALFDFSFLESARLTGNRAGDLIEMFTGRSTATLGENEIFYALRVDSAGGINADWTVWRTGKESFDVMSGRREDILDLLSCSGPGVAVVDMTADRATFAVQGPRALDALHKLGDVGRIELLKYYAFDRACLGGIPCTIGRLGYTGEPGFEIIVGREQARDLWDALSSHVAAAGFIAADMLRIEAGFVLFSNEFRLPVSPFEVSLGKFSRPTDPPKPAIKLVSFLADADRQSWPWRPSHDVQRPSTLGEVAVTSACQSVVAGGILGLGYVLAETSPNTVLHDNAGTFRNIRLTPRPFYDTAKRRPREPWLQSAGRQLR